MATAAGPEFELIFPPMDLVAGYNAAADRIEAMIGVDVTSAFGAQIAQLMVTRMRDGQDIRGAAFTPYKDSTIQQKVAKGQQVAPVNLTDSGDMLAALVGLEDQGDIVVRFDDANMDERMGFHQFGTKRMDARPGFGLDAEEELFVFAAMQRIWDSQTVPGADTELERFTG